MRRDQRQTDELKYQRRRSRRSAFSLGVGLTEPNRCRCSLLSAGTPGARLPLCGNEANGVERKV